MLDDPSIVRMTFLSLVCVFPTCVRRHLLNPASTNHLGAPAVQDLPWPLRLRILKQAAAGVLHLHREAVVHADLAARNVRLATALDCVVSHPPPFCALASTDSHFCTHSGHFDRQPLLHAFRSLCRQCYVLPPFPFFPAAIGADHGGVCGAGGRLWSLVGAPGGD